MREIERGKGIMDTRFEGVLEILHLELSRKDMMVLGALLKSQRSPTSFVDFDTIRKQLAIDEGEKKGKDPLIYRSLSWLESMGFIGVDRSQQKHGYNADVVHLHNALRQAIHESINEIENEIQRLDDELESINKIDITELGHEIISYAAGEQKIEKPIFAEGWENVLQLLEDKIYSTAKTGDLVRFSMEWMSNVEIITPRRLEILRKLMERGVTFHGLEHNKISKKHLKAFSGYTRAYREQGFNPGFRICERQNSTYQFVGRNDDGIVLITSEDPMSATWIPRNANPALVDNAIETFDADYEAGIDFEEWGAT